MEEIQSKFAGVFCPENVRNLPRVPNTTLIPGERISRNLEYLERISRELVCSCHRID